MPSRWEDPSGPCPMSLSLGQLIFTSFPGVGFKTLSSAQVPTKVQQAFIKHIAHRYWDAYNPPEPGYRAAYLHQVAPEHTLFGWLYGEDTDDLGRNRVPYFLCYYLGEVLQKPYLQTIFDCLKQGPVERLDRQIEPQGLKQITLSNGCNYPPACPGIAIPMEIYLQSHSALNQGQLLNVFVPVHGGIVLEQNALPDQPGYASDPFQRSSISSQGSQGLIKAPPESRPPVQSRIDLKSLESQSLPLAALLKQGQPKKLDFRLDYRNATFLVVIGLLITLGLGVYRLSQGQNGQAADLLQRSTTLEQKRSYERCIANLETIPEDSISLG